ncbi:PAS domain-containing protein [Microvirga lotononidis]|nr:PAS domain-containing protein [Microvirga lotononidis]WQO31337.1 PAS domain-containing protein [Microvirga lotononidis]
MLKERLRDSVRVTIRKLDEHLRIVPTRDIAPLVLTGDIRDAGELLMNSPDVSALEITSSQACRVALRGPELIIEAANKAFVRSAGRDGFLGLPGWEAFPELRGQGYLELLDQVYRTKKPFVGLKMPILFQPSKGAPMEEHVTDFIYRPIEDGSGHVTGVFIESYDRTEWARA